MATNYRNFIITYDKHRMGTVRFTIKILVSDCYLLSLANFWKRNDIFR
jgi:hypothetical protein